MSKPKLRLIINGQDDIARKIARDCEAGQKRAVGDFLRDVADAIETK
jgi:hypothetical protein